MGCGASAAQMPHEPPVGSAMAAIKHQRSLEKVDVIERKPSLDERKPSIDSAASTELSNDNASDDSKPDTIADFISQFRAASDEDVRLALQEVDDGDSQRLQKAIHACALQDMCKAACEASDSTLEKFVGDLEASAYQKLRDAVELTKAKSTVSNPRGEIISSFARDIKQHTLVDLAKAAKHVSDTELKEALRGLSPDTTQKLLATLIKVQFSECIDAFRSSSDDETLAALQSLSAGEREKITKALGAENTPVQQGEVDHKTAHPQTIAGFIRVVSSATDVELKKYCEGLSASQHEMLSKACVRADYIHFLNSASENDIQTAIDALPKEQRQAVIDAVKSLPSSAP